MHLGYFGLISIFSIYLFLFFLARNANVCNYADNATFYTCDQDLHNLILRLQQDWVLAIERFKCNYMKLTRVCVIC